MRDKRAMEIPKFESPIDLAITAFVTRSSYLNFLISGFSFILKC